MKDIYLNNNDLNDFKLKLNEYNDRLAHAGQEYVEMKFKISNGESEKSEKLIYIEKHRIAKKEYNEIAKTPIFKDNFLRAKVNFQKYSKNDPKYQEALEIYVEAKRLLKNSKLAIRERGVSGELSKLSNVALELKDLTFSYKSNSPIVVNKVSVKVNQGEYVAIIGHNGSGKSTLSKLIIGVLTPISGSMSIFGNHVTRNNLNIVRKFLGIVFQNPDNQFIGSTVKDDIAFGLENRRIDPKLMQEKIETAAKKVRMENFLDHEPLMLSGGQKQRVAIASALALSPDIIIFDEATSMLDPKGKREVKEIMVELKNTREKTIFSITHDMDEILNADKVMVMNNGKLVKFGSPEEILEDRNFLRSIHLDIPFIAQVEESLEELGIKVSHSDNLDELVGKIWKK
ncbi:cobalt ABC transporter ATP-binding subunit [Spiroplasma sabaudiense Ar-1343]|uniref:Cobalt ABC transporter ATP-binding subunit n=1 Tax=Spiroplasma sabaudiense Ar-1343 TaxID=1276257 RepID=W6AB98_9MOLU|nr:energy-coupling factor transporter ATPase [Spiroplasma sabaudiense]AHI54130.1 cobalt ABC transporter ATP-binding subunit [Spiroplasma sabaudiense Ar-1343]